MINVICNTITHVIRVNMHIERVDCLYNLINQCVALLMLWNESEVKVSEEVLKFIYFCY